MKERETCKQFCGLLELNRRISFDFKFSCFGIYNKNNKSLFKNKRLLFSQNEKSVSSIFLQKMIPRPVIIQLYCFRLFFENHFRLNNRLFVFSMIDNCVDFGCHSNEILNYCYFKLSEIPLPSFNSLQDFKHIEQKTPEILHFHYFTVLQVCVCDVIFV